MNPAGRQKFVSVTPPAAKVDNAAFTTAAVDTKGWRRCTFVVQYGDIDINVVSSKIRHSDASDMSNSADLATGGTDYSLGTASGSDNKIHAFDVDCRGKKRYLDFEMTGGDGSTGTYLAVIAILSEPEIAPDSAADRGCEVYATV